ncbi:MAG: NUDIX hydrolase [Paludibacteraceae bacterium]|nr:NUDIX hydrolase [Paludibacteraceae bacterium]
MKNWEIKETEVMMKTPIGTIQTTRKIDPKGVERKYISMQAPDWVCAVVQYGANSDDFMMVKQFRHGINREITEFPSGMVDKGEEPLEALYRELDEELGIKRENVLQLEKLYTGSPNPAFMENQISCYYVVADGYGKNNPDEDEFLETVIVKRADMEQIISQEDYNVMMRLAWEMFLKGKSVPTW